MTASPHPVAIEHLPGFITAPGETDVLMWVMAVILAVSVLSFGILFLRLHTLPERIAHKSHKFQFEIVAVLGLIALFTHMHIFWVIGLMLALIDFPDIGGWLGRIADRSRRLLRTNLTRPPQEPLAMLSSAPRRTKAPTRCHNTRASSASGAAIPRLSSLGASLCSSSCSARC